MKTLAESIYAICYQKCLEISHKTEIEFICNSLFYKEKLINMSEWFKNNNFNSKIGYVDSVEIRNHIDLIESYLSISNKLGS